MPAQTTVWSECLSCAVCYEDFGSKHHPVSLPCSHTICKSCLEKLQQLKCPLDQNMVTTELIKLPVNNALLRLTGGQVDNNEDDLIDILGVDAPLYISSQACIEEVALKLKQTGLKALSRPMQRKVVNLITCQLIEAEGQERATRAARSLGERVVMELILQHQNPQQLSSNLWAAVRNRGCQFLGPAMQEDVLKLILLALEDGSALSRKVLVLFVVQRLEKQYPQASKTAIGHVVQLLYRASCFMVTKRNEESSLMQLKEEYRVYDMLRREHDSQVIQIALEAGLRIAPEQWSSLLYGDSTHKSHMQSIIDKLQTPESFMQSVSELVVALQRMGDPANLMRLQPHFELLANIDPNTNAPSWENIEAVMHAVKICVDGLTDFIENHSQRRQETLANNPKYKTSMCRDFQIKGPCPRGAACHFAHSVAELDRHRNKAKRPLNMNSADTDVENIENTYTSCKSNILDEWEILSDEQSMPIKEAHPHLRQRAEGQEVLQNHLGLNGELESSHGPQQVNRQSSTHGPQFTERVFNGSPYRQTDPNGYYGLPYEPQMQPMAGQQQGYSNPSDIYQKYPHDLPPEGTYQKLPPGGAVHQQLAPQAVQQSLAPSGSFQHLTPGGAHHVLPQGRTHPGLPPGGVHHSSTYAEQNYQEQPQRGSHLTHRTDYGPGYQGVSPGGPYHGYPPPGASHQGYYHAPRDGPQHILPPGGAAQGLYLGYSVDPYQEMHHTGVVHRNPVPNRNQPAYPGGARFNPYPYEGYQQPTVPQNYSHMYDSYYPQGHLPQQVPPGQSHIPVRHSQHPVQYSYQEDLRQPPSENLSEMSSSKRKLEELHQRRNELLAKLGKKPPSDPHSQGQGQGQANTDYRAQVISEEAAIVYPPSYSGPMGCKVADSYATNRAVQNLDDFEEAVLRGQVENFPSQDDRGLEQEQMPELEEVDEVDPLTLWKERHETATSEENYEDQDEIIPFDESPTVSKYGPISRYAKIDSKMKQTNPVQVTAQQGSRTTPINTAYPSDGRPMVASFQQPSRFNQASSFGSTDLPSYSTVSTTSSSWPQDSHVIGYHVASTLSSVYPSTDSLGKKTTAEMVKVMHEKVKNMPGLNKPAAASTAEREQLKQELKVLNQQIVDEEVSSELLMIETQIQTYQQGHEAIDSNETTNDLAIARQLQEMEIQPQSVIIDPISLRQREEQEAIDREMAERTQDMERFSLGVMDTQQQRHDREIKDRILAEEIALEEARRQGYNVITEGVNMAGTDNFVDSPVGHGSLPSNVEED